MSDTLTMNLPLDTEYIKGDEQLIITSESGDDFYYTADFTLPALWINPATIPPVGPEPTDSLPPPFSLPPVPPGCGRTLIGKSGQPLPFPLAVPLGLYPSAYLVPIPPYTGVPPFPLFPDPLKGNGLAGLVAPNSVQVLFFPVYTVIKAISKNDVVPPPVIPGVPVLYSPTLEFGPARYIYPPKLSNNICTPQKPTNYPPYLPYPPPDKLKIGDELKMENNMGDDYEIMFSIDNQVTWNLWTDPIPTTPNRPDGEFEIKIFAYVRRKDNHNIKSGNRKHYIYLKPE